MIAAFDIALNLAFLYTIDELFIHKKVIQSFA